MAISPRIPLLKSFLRIGFAQCAVPQKRCSKRIRVFLSFLGGKSHLPSVVSQKTNDGGEDKHHDGISEMDSMEQEVWPRAMPEDENDLQDEQEDGKLNLSFDIIDEF